MRLMLDKQVKSVVCGSNFTAAICLHKWFSGADQSICSGCRLPFGFTRKRHNCYNCGLVFCHACSAKKCLKASLAPNPSRPYRVCDNCFTKLKKAVESGSTTHSLVNRRGTANCQSYDISEKQEKLDAKTQIQLSRFSTMEEFKPAESRSSSRRNRKPEFHSSRVSPIPNCSSQRGNVNLSTSFHPVISYSKKFFSASLPGSRIMSRATSPVSRRSSPPRSTTPTPTLAGLKSTNIILEDVNKKNDALSQEVAQLRVQLKDMAERLPGGPYNHNRPGLLPTYTHCLNSSAKDGIVASETRSPETHGYHITGDTTFPDAGANGIVNPSMVDGFVVASNKISIASVQGRPSESNKLFQSQSIDEVARSGMRGPTENEHDHEPETEWVEQDEPGVYITLAQLPGGDKDLKRVRFRCLFDISHRKAM